MFMMNMKGTLDENQLQDLGLILNLAKRLQDKNGMSEEEMIDGFPNMMWILRDFTLQMLDENGDTITSKQYLENALKEIPGVSDMIEDKNRLRRGIKSCFPKRDCVILKRPAEDEKIL